MKTLAVGVEFSIRTDGRTEGHTDRHDEDKSRFLQFCERTKKWLVSLPFRILYIANILLFQFQNYNPSCSQQFAAGFPANFSVI